MPIFLVPHFLIPIDLEKGRRGDKHQHPATSHTTTTMDADDEERIEHHTISLTLIVALIVLICLIVLPNVFLAPTNPKDKAE